MSDARISHETLARIGAGDLESFVDSYGRVIDESTYPATDKAFNQRKVK
jgi:hypothetical protein